MSYLKNNLPEYRKETNPTKGSFHIVNFCNWIQFNNTVAKYFHMYLNRIRHVYNIDQRSPLTL